MAKCRPAKWVPWAFLGAGLPLLAALATTTPSLLEKIKTSAGQSTSAGETTAWAELVSNGRDIEIKGTAPGQDAVDAAVKAVAGTYGVRTVKATAQIVEPVKLIAPTVESVNVTSATPEIKGTWHEGVATALAVGIAGKTYELQKNPELTTMAGNWTLKLAEPLAEGTYDVTVDASNETEKLSAAAPGKVVVDLPDPAPTPVIPAAPTVTGYVGNDVKPMLSGTWPEAEAKAANQNLEVKLGETAFVLGKNPELTSDGAGNWMLMPSLPLLEGELQVLPTIVDAAGVAVVAAEPAKAVIDITPPALPEIVMPTPDMQWPYAISGKWPEAAGNTLSATLAGKTYDLGKGEELKSDGQGNFTFDPKVELAPGSYDIDFSVNDAVGNTAKQALRAAIVIAEAPKVEPLKPATPEAIAADAKWPYAITGAWDDRPGNTLSATLAGRSYGLGKDPELTSSGQGRFSFAPTAELAPGTYDVDFTTNDAAGATEVMTLKAAVVVPEQAPPPLAAPLVDAVATGAVWPYAITGTWDERPGHTLAASVAGQTYDLGAGAPLSGNGAGKFTFAAPQSLAPGKYPVTFTVKDAAGATEVTTVADAIIVPEPAAPEPAPVVEKVAVPAPTVKSLIDLTGAPLVRGTWPHTIADKFSVALAGRTYTLGQDKNLTTKEGNWTLFPATGLKDGKYDVIAVASKGAGNLTFDTTKAELDVDADEPANPTVVSYAGDVSPAELTGTWDQGNATALKVTVPAANLTAELGAAGSPLYSDGKGNWRLVLPQALAAGTYDVDAVSMDRHRRLQNEDTKGEVVIVAKGTEPPPPPPPYDCVAVMNRIGNVFPIRFEYDLTDITKPFDLSVSQYAALLKDARCTAININIEGHADFKGSESYNVELSQRRADLILNMLKDAGVDTARMSTVGLGETAPLDPNTTDEARMKNRRVQISIRP